MKRWIGLLLTVCLLTGALGATGCLRSRVVITSEPSGAEVIWRGQPYAATPVEIPFIWYWYYDYALEKPGYEPVEVVERFRTPPWFLFPMDFLLEVAPVPIKDTRRRHYVLKKTTPNASEMVEFTAPALPGAPGE